MEQKKGADFRFFEELNDFLPSEKRKQWFTYYFKGNPSIKDSIEANGVPHTEIDLIMVNGNSVGFEYQLKDGDRVSCYPVFESFDIAGLTRLREEPLRNTKFILDVHLGKLARVLRMLGFDSLYSNKYEDREIVDIARAENRIILSRDIGLFKRRDVTHGYWVRSTHSEVQAFEVLKRFDLFRKIMPFTRCKACNSPLVPIEKEKILHRLEPKTRKYYNDFYTCRKCGRIYWKGSHYYSMLEKIHA